MREKTRNVRGDKTFCSLSLTVSHDQSYKNMIRVTKQATACRAGPMQSSTGVSSTGVRQTGLASISSAVLVVLVVWLKCRQIMIDDQAERD